MGEKITISKVKNYFNKKHIIVMFCQLSTEVNNILFKMDTPTDCFCDEHSKGFQYDGKVLLFIQEAVQEKINRGV